DTYGRDAPGAHPAEASRFVARRTRALRASARPRRRRRRLLGPVRRGIATAAEINAGRALGAKASGSRVEVRLAVPGVSGRDLGLDGCGAPEDEQWAASVAREMARGAAEQPASGGPEAARADDQEVHAVAQRCELLTGGSVRRGCVDAFERAEL